MDSLIPTNEYTEFEDRLYQNPQTGIDENQQFIENLRSVQQQNNAQINADTRALGTDVPSNLGGLTGGEGYFTSRMQTPQTNVVTANLRAAAQAAALNQALANEQAIWKKRYNDAYRAYQKRAYDKANPTTPSSTTELDIDTNVSDGGKTEVSFYTDGKYEKGKLYPVTDYVSNYQDESGQWWQVSNPTERDVAFGPNTNPLLYRAVNENVVNVNGKDFIYLDNVPNKDPAWYRVDRISAPDTYSAYAGE